MIKDLFIKIKKKLCRHHYNPSSYYVTDNHIVCEDICSKCGERKISNYDIKKESYIKSLGYKKDFCAGIWASAINTHLGLIDYINNFKTEVDPKAKKVTITAVNMPSIKNYSIDGRDMNE